MEPHKFARMLAKIAHGVAVAFKGLDAFEPLLPDLILGNTDLAPYLIGGSGSCAPIPKDRPMHEAEVKWRNYAVGRLLVCHIRLFVLLETPVYYVIVGRPRT